MRDFLDLRLFHRQSAFRRFIRRRSNRLRLACSSRSIRLRSILYDLPLRRLHRPPLVPLHSTALRCPFRRQPPAFPDECLFALGVFRGKLCDLRRCLPLHIGVLCLDGMPGCLPMLPGLSLKSCVSGRHGFLGANDGRCADIPVFCRFGGMCRRLFLLLPLDMSAFLMERPVS